MPLYVIIDRKIMEEDNDCPIVEQYTQPQPPKDEIIESAIAEHIERQWADNCDYDGSFFIVARILSIHEADTGIKSVKVDLPANLT